MKTKQELETLIKEYKGDKRKKEYKDLKEQLNSLEPVDLTQKDDCDDCNEQTKKENPSTRYVEQEEYDFIQALKSPIEWVDVKRVFIINNRLYNKKHKPCRCSNRIKTMINNLKKYVKVNG